MRALWALVRTDLGLYLADRRTLLTGALAGLLAGCGEGTWLGETAPPPLPGERKSVLLIEDQLRADPRLAELNITLPPAVRNPDWPQSGGNAAHAMEHLEAAESLSLAWRVDVGARDRAGLGACKTDCVTVHKKLT